jgi:hypothetical protein
VSGQECSGSHEKQLAKMCYKLAHVTLFLLSFNITLKYCVERLITRSHAAMVLKYIVTQSYKIRRVVTSKRYRWFTWSSRKFQCFERLITRSHAAMVLKYIVTIL